MCALNGLIAKARAGLLRVLCVVSLLGSSAAGADDDALFSPMLTVRMGDQVIELEREDLAALTQTQLNTSTTLQPEAANWQGVLGRDVLKLLGLDAGDVRPMSMMSWDDYRIDMSTEDFYRWDVLLASAVNDQPLSMEDLGPLRVIYPRDHFTELQDSRFDHRWVWMLREIVVTPK